jgi:cyclic pyranopterin monophosphate synthase
MTSGDEGGKASHFTLHTSHFSHLSPSGDARMVDVSDKAVTAREAVAEGRIVMSAETRRLLFSGAVKKGDALAVARVAGIQAAKRTADLIPLCHPIQTTFAEVLIEEIEEGARVQATVRVTERTGVEMEALTAATVALLTLYDMLKGTQKDLQIEGVRLLRKTGGKAEYVAG